MKPVNHSGTERERVKHYLRHNQKANISFSFVGTVQTVQKHHRQHFMKVRTRYPMFLVALIFDVYSDFELPIALNRASAGFYEGR